MTHLSLFSGIGGLDIAAEWAGFTTVGQCEWADYPTKILEKHWPDVPRWRDIRTLTKENFYERTGLRTVDIISGGFPCQPFSVAGKQAGKEDERFLWPEMLRVITEIKPRCVVGENVPGILRIAAADIVEDLERAGYNCIVFAFEAASVGAPHRRERVAFVGYTEHNGPPSEPQLRSNEATGNCWRPEKQGAAFKSERTSRSSNVPSIQRGEGGAEIVAYAGGERLQRGEQYRAYTEGCGQELEGAYQPAAERSYDGREISANTNCTRLEGGRSEPRIKTELSKERTAKRDWWAAEPDVGRVAHGIPNRVDRIKCLGNAVVPQQFYPIFKALAEIMEDENG